MYHEASEKEDEEIKEMQKKLLTVMRSNENRNIGVAAIMALFVKEYREAKQDKKSLLKDMEICWDYYEGRAKKPKYSSPHAKLVEQLFRGFN